MAGSVDDPVTPPKLPAMNAAGTDLPDQGGQGEAGRRPIVSTQTKVLYGLGSVAFGVKDNGFATFAMLFYNQVIGLRAELVSATILIALVADAFVDPLVGLASDNLRSRLGRRHPFMYLSALPVALSYLLLWNPPHWSEGYVLLYLLVCAIVVRTFITFYEIPSSALVAELSPDYDQRTVLFAWRYFFGWAGGLGMMILALSVLLRPDATHHFGQLNPAGYRNYGLVAGAVMFVAIVVSALGTHRFIPQFHVPERRSISIAGMLGEMFATLKNRSFLVLTVAGIFFYVATGLVFALNQYFVTYLWGLSAAQAALFGVLGIFSAAFAFVFAMPLSRRLGKKRASIWLFAVGLAIGIAPITLRLFGLFPANGAPILLPLLLLASTLSLTLSIASSVLLASMLTDVVENSELRTARRSEGVFFAANGFMQKMSSGMGLFVSGLLLGLVHFPVHAIPGHVDTGIVARLAAIYIVTLLVLYGIALLFVSGYGISRAGHEETLRQLALETARAGPPP